MKFVSLRDAGAALVDYEKTWDLQRRLVESVARGETPNTVLFVEHPSVITRGRGLQFTGESRDRHAPAPSGPEAAGIPLVDIDRGGDLTWHGPGQLVVYPILKLDGIEAPARDVEKYLRGFERATIAVLAQYGVTGATRKNEAGVWVVRPGETAPDKKIASIGIGVRRWTTFHGLALNVKNGLEPYRSFDPCGFDSGVMISLESLASAPLGDDWRADLERAFARELTVTFSSGPSDVSVQDLDAFSDLTI